MFSWYKYLIVSLVFSHLGFWSGNLFLIAPFPDLCLLVPFHGHNLTLSFCSGSQHIVSCLVLVVVSSGQLIIKNKQINHDNHHDESKTKTYRLPDDRDPSALNSLLKVRSKRETPVEPVKQHILVYGIMWFRLQMADLNVVRSSDRPAEVVPRLPRGK